MKKIVFLIAVCMGAILLGGCAGKETGASAAEATLEESPEMLESMVSRLVEANPVENAREIDDFSVENEMALTMGNLDAYKGYVTNNQADCALVFAALCKEGTVESVKEELEAYRQTMTSSLYLEFADKIQQAKDARIVVSGNYVLMVMAGVSGPDYAKIDEAIEQVLQP